MYPLVLAEMEDSRNGSSRDPSPEPDGPSPAPLREQVYEWSTGLADWQRDLLRRLARGPLSLDDERDLLAILTGAAEAPRPCPLELEDLPVEDSESAPLELLEISDVRNVNLLAEGQSLCFRPGMNVVFGATGTGKSGYGRLLRRLSQPSRRIEVLHNAFDVNAGDEPQTAQLRIAAGETTREVAVDLAGEPDPELCEMAVFDSESVAACVAASAVIEHIPPPLLLMRRMAEAQEMLRGCLKDRIAARRAELPKLPEGNPVTAAGRALASIGAQSDPAELERLATLSERERAELAELDAALVAGASDQSRRLEAAARARGRAANVVAEKLELSGERLSDSRIAEIADIRTRLEEARSSERALAAEAFSGQAFPGTGQQAWREMWEAARRFAEDQKRDLHGEGADAACPLCQQQLDAEACERIAKFEEFVHSDLREKVAELSEKLERAMGGLPDVEALGTLVEGSLAGAPEQVADCARKAVDRLAARERLARRHAEGQAAKAERNGELFSVARVRTYADEQAAAAETQVAARDEQMQRPLIDRRAELRSRERLAEEMPAISRHIGVLRDIYRLKETAERLRTSTISSQLRRLQQDVVTDRLREAIVEELKAFDLLSTAINVAGKVKKGRTTVEFWLRGGDPGRVDTGEVLSEGERRALALALFLAERAVSGGRSAIVLDDPVALLDHERRAHVARRLLEEAGRRQVIVFTHDLAFVQMLQRAAAASGEDLHSQALERAYGRAGFPAPAADVEA